MLPEKAAMDVEDLLKIVLVLVIVILVLEVVGRFLSLLGALSPLIGLLIVVLIVAWFLDYI